MGELGEGYSLHFRLDLTVLRNKIKSKETRKEYDLQPSVQNTTSSLHLKIIIGL